MRPTDHVCRALWVLLGARLCWGSASSCPEGETADKFLLHFKPDHPKGIPGAELPEPTPLMSPLLVGPVTLVDPHVWGLSQTVLHNFSIQAHLFRGTASLTIPRLEMFGIYELPGLWWTTTGNFSVTLLDLGVTTGLKLAVLEDSCFYVQDFQSVITKSNFSYHTDGLLDDSGLLDIFFDDLIELVVNVTKPTILEIVNQYVRSSLTNFLPPNVSTQSLPDPTTAQSPPTDALTHSSLVGERGSNSSTGIAALPRIPTHEEQKEALIRFVRYQIPWMIGDPLLLTDITLNILAIAELHNMSVHNLEKVSQVQHLSLKFDGENFVMKTRMLHEDLFNRHRVLWFPGAIFKTWQWTRADLGLVKHEAVLQLDRRLLSPPTILEFTMRPVIFNPDHESSGIRTMDRLTRRLLDGIRTKFGDSIKAFLYSPIVSKVNRVLRAVDARSLIKDFVCYAAGVL